LLFGLAQVCYHVEKAASNYDELRHQVQPRRGVSNAYGIFRSKHVEGICKFGKDACFFLDTHVDAS